MATTVYRDWQPGDGLRCSFAKAAPIEVPCGPPVTTAIKEVDVIDRKPFSTKKPLCKNHAPGGLLPNVLVAEAKKIAIERLCVEHWDDFEKYYRDAIASIATKHDSS
jgi:hypothetical protein